MTQAVNIIQSFKCGTAAILPNRIVALGATGLAVVAIGSDSLMIGVSTQVGGDINAAIDVVVGGIAYLAIESPLAAGTLLSSGGTGRGIEPDQGYRIVAVLLEPAVAAGQICKVMLCQSVF